MLLIAILLLVQTIDRDQVRSSLSFSLALRNENCGPSSCLPALFLFHFSPQVTAPSWLVSGQSTARENHTSSQIHIYCFTRTERVMLNSSVCSKDSPPETRRCWWQTCCDSWEKHLQHWLKLFQIGPPTLSINIKNKDKEDYMFFSSLFIFLGFSFHKKHFS